MKPQCVVLLGALARGERLTMLDALQRYGIAACSQRVTDLRRAGYRIDTEMIQTNTGKRIARYALVAKVPEGV